MKVENGMPVLSKFRCILYTSTEDIIIDIIKPHKDFSDTINQHQIADEFMELRDEHMTARRVRRLRKKGIKVLLRARYILRNSRRGQQELF